jgi:RNA polymerase sigma-70 factor (ECF subfamily)
MGRATAVEPVAEPAREAACTLYERHGARVFHFCLGRLRSREEAEDARQTTFLYALAALRRGVVPVAEASWLLKIADNVCRARRHDARRRARFEVVEDPEALQRVSAPAGAAVETLMPLDEALARLTDLQREALLLREWRGLSSREIAEHLATTPGAVDVLLLRARRALADGLDAPVEPRRRLRSLDLASLAGAAKSLFAGLAGKAAVAAIVAVVGASAGAVGLRERDAGPSAPRPAPMQRVAPVLGRAPASVVPAGDAPTPVRRDTAGRPRPSRLPVTQAPQESEVVAEEASPAAETAPRHTVSAGEESKKTPGQDPLVPVTSAAEPVVETVVETVTSTVEPVVGMVTSAADPVVGTVASTAEPVVGMVASTAEPVVETLTSAAEPVVTAAAAALPAVPPPALP